MTDRDPTARSPAEAGRADHQTDACGAVTAGALIGLTGAAVNYGVVTRQVAEATGQTPGVDIAALTAAALSLGIAGVLAVLLLLAAHLIRRRIVTGKPLLLVLTVPCLLFDVSCLAGSWPMVITGLAQATAVTAGAIAATSRRAGAPPMTR